MFDQSVDTQGEGCIVNGAVGEQQRAVFLNLCGHIISGRQIIDTRQSRRQFRGKLRMCQQGGIWQFRLSRAQIRSFISAWQKVNGIFPLIMKDSAFPLEAYSLAPAPLVQSAARWGWLFTSC